MLNFISILSDTVKVGDFFIISGYSSKNAQNIKILLACGKSENSNIALKISQNFGKILRSAIVNGNSLCEENEENLTCSSNFSPPQAGDLFTFCILVTDDRFHISVNDEEFCFFKFQMPSNLIRSVMVSGDVEVINKANHVRTFPFLFPSIKSDYEDLAFESFSPREFEAGDVVVVQGVVEGKPDGEFKVMFLEDETLRELVHFNVRFDERSVVMNNMDCEEEWTENEIRSENFPFHIGFPFKIAFAFTNSEIKTAVNGNSLMNYPLDWIDIGDGGDTLWEILTGIRVKNGDDMTVKINAIEVVKDDKNGGGFEGFSVMNQSF